MLQDSDRSWVIACHSRDIRNILLHYYRLENINSGNDKWWSGRDMVWVLVGVRDYVLRPTEQSLVTLFPCLCRLSTGHCISLEASHRFIIPSTYLGMGVGKTCCSLGVGSDSFWTDWLEVGMVEVLAPHRVWDSGAGAWSSSLDGDLDPVTGG